MRCIAAPLLCRLRLGYLCVEPGMHFFGHWGSTVAVWIPHCYKMLKVISYNNERTLMCREPWGHDLSMIHICSFWSFNCSCWPVDPPASPRGASVLVASHRGDFRTAKPTKLQTSSEYFQLCSSATCPKIKAFFHNLQVGSVPFLQLKTNQILGILDLTGWPPSCSDQEQWVRVVL